MVIDYAIWRRGRIENRMWLHGMPRNANPVLIALVMRAHVYQCWLQ